uniref:Poly [ADP-ribose] polymerase n=1 Tax=Laticauda laticaudata TaxID=8630 RepID=A0A8C5RSJ3_LATLA
MAVAIFASCIFFLKIKKLKIIEKNRLKRSIKENGGQIAFGLNQQCTHVVTEDANALSPRHLKTIQKYELPMVNVDFIWESIKEKKLLQCENYELSQTLPFKTAKTSEEARRLYALSIQDLKKTGFELRKDFPYQAEYLVSEKLQEMLIADAVSSSVLSEEVGRFVELIWTEAVGHLNSLLDRPVTRISLNDVSRAEGILLQAKTTWEERGSLTELSAIMSEFYKVIPHKNVLDDEVSKKLIYIKRDLCQLIRDMLNISEINMSVLNPSSLSKYRALRCRIDALDVKNEEFNSVKHFENLIQVLNIYKVSRTTESMLFERNLGNVQSLFHGSSVCNFVGILSRGLLLPNVAEDYALERTDFGYLGSGIYFSNSVRTSIKYSQPCETDGTRLLLICDVALGNCWKTKQYYYCSSEGPPLCHDSVHGVRRTEKKNSIFEVFDLATERIFSKETTSLRPWLQYVCTFDLSCLDYTLLSHDLLNDISAGLLDRAGNPIPLKDIQIKGRIIDFVAEIVVFQTYENETESPIEAKYVFPLDDTAAVCGFEAFIKGKHIIGEVKEKEKAHQEYREAISRGNGAYLMDQDAPDVFTVSVGNLPPSTKVLIKITYITELSYENGNLCFHLPAAVAPWQQDKALNEITQVSMLSYSICSFSFFFLDARGFSMEILIGDVYLPRMWVEKHPDENSEACMLVFQPEFEVPFDHLSLHGEVIICLDCSNSMAGSAIQQAKEIALHALNSCHLTRKISVLKFGTSKTSLWNYVTFSFFSTATMGDSNLWKVLRYLCLLYPTKSKRNIILISDGHIQNEGMTLQVVKKNAVHTRIFTCGVSPTANRHMLRSLSHYGAGAFEYFDVKSKYNWERKVKSQTTRMLSSQCSSISIEWQTHVTENPKLSFTPSQICALFNHERLLVYGFILNCTEILHKLAARAFIREYEQGMLDESETQHEMKREQLKSNIIELSLKHSIVTQFTSFVAIEKRVCMFIFKPSFPHFFPKVGLNY